MDTGEPGYLEHLIDRHMALVEVRRRLAIEAERAAPRLRQPLEQGPWITVSKELGSGGIGIAGRVAARLGWHVFDREVLEAIARSTRSREKILSRLDERAVGRLEEFFANLLHPRAPSRYAFLQEMMRVIWALGRDGHAVLLGRGANWLLEDRFGLRVRITAPPEMRIAAVAEREKMPAAAARKKVRADDGRRIRFIRQAFGRDIADPLGYDLSVNTGSLAPEAAVQVILSALELKLGIRPASDAPRREPIGTG